MDEQPIPLLTHAQAETVGQQLHDRWHVMAGAVPLTRDDLAWADIEQFVLRTAYAVSKGQG